MDEKIEKLKEMIAGSDNIVFLGGAGVSTESGLKDFRSQDGIYAQKYKYPPEVMLGADFFENFRQEFFEFYRKNLMVCGIKPSDAHYALADLEKVGKLKAVITQNIDGLHQDAGSRNVLELHGSVKRNYCTRCGRFYSDKDIRNMELVPFCSCGGVIKPDVVLYGESLDMSVYNAAVRSVRECDMLIVGGTSLTVYPAAGLIEYYEGERFVLINKDPTPYDSMASLVINGSIGNALRQATEEYRR